MHKGLLPVALALAGALAWPADCLTDGYGVRRDAWQRNGTILSTSNAKDIRLLGKLKLDNQPRQMHSLFPPLINDGAREAAIEAGVSDNLYAIDVEKGELIWNKQFTSAWKPPADGGRGAGILCPGGFTATPVLAPDGGGKYAIYAVSWDGSLHQVNAADGEDVAPPLKFMPLHGKPYPLNLFHGVFYTHTAQGCGGNPNMVYAYDLATHKVASWGPAGGGMWGRTGPAISADGVMYTGTGDGRWDSENGLFGDGIIGVKQNPGTKALEPNYYGPTNAEWLVKRDLDMQVTPVIFNYHGRELMVDAGKECRLYLMDTKSIGGGDHRTPLYRNPLLCNEDVNFASAGIWGSLASWEDAKGARWLLTPIWGSKHSQFSAPLEHGPVKYGAILAFPVEERNGGFTLVPAWISRDMNRAEPPVIANGVVYAYGNGEDTDQAYPDVGLDDEAYRRIPGSTHAVLYALDAQTNKELWSSGDQIRAWNHFSGLSIANGRVYIGAYDSVLYCFGVQK